MRVQVSPKSRSAKAGAPPDSLLLVPGLGMGSSDVTPSGRRPVEHPNDNFARVNVTYIAARSPTTRIREFAALGIRRDRPRRTTRTEDRSVEGAGMRYAQSTMTTNTPPKSSMVETFLQIVTVLPITRLRALCRGRHRTGVMTCYRRPRPMEADRRQRDEAVQLGPAHHPSSTICLRLQRPMRPPS